jgi:hypothetical protein
MRTLDTSLLSMLKRITYLELCFIKENKILSDLKKIINEWFPYGTKG